MVHQQKYDAAPLRWEQESLKGVPGHHEEGSLLQKGCAGYPTGTGEIGVLCSPVCVILVVVMTVSEGVR